MRTAIVILKLFVCLTFVGYGQTAADVAVQLSVTTQISPSEITLHWTANSTTNGYQVYRKLKTATSWGPLLVNLTGTTNQYTDNTVTPGVNYEYRVFRSGQGYSGNGYVSAGINVPEIEYRGRLLLIVDSTFTSSLDPELRRLAEDMEGDGWEVVRRDVDRNGSVQHVKNVIVSEYNNDPANAKAVFLFGHVPVPYSGNLNPDAHPNHLGAWPADVFYGDVNGNWTDNAVTSTTASPARTQNVPGDGKFDQSAVPGDVELQVGRVDLSALPSFSATGNELQLLKNYLDKDHEYRKKLFVPQHRAVIDDNFGYFSGEAFAASGWRSFAPLVGASNVTAGDYITSLNGGSYLWSYGCGGGSFTSASGIGNTAAIASASLQGVFTMLFGSYFGDWDVSNSFLRAPLANGRILTNVWSGRPHYHFHHMGLGENIGYSLLITQNYSGSLYFSSPFSITGKWIHNALMGDPTLRNDVVAPVSDVVATRSGFHCNINWNKSPDSTVLGYHIYMRNDTVRSYTRVNPALITDTAYTDSCMFYKGIYKYMVRAVKLETVPSGTYYNMSEGISDTALNVLDPAVTASFAIIPGTTTFTFLNTSTGTGSYFWNAGNGQTSGDTNMVATYSNNGIYIITLVHSNECDSDTSTQAILVQSVDLPGIAGSQALSAYPNPTPNRVTISGDINGTLVIRNMLGQILFETRKSSTEIEVDLSSFPSGLYLAELLTGSESTVIRLQRE